MSAANEEKPTTVESMINNADVSLIEKERASKILKAKELYSHGSRNFLVKSYMEAADELSQVCGLYEELYGELSDELGMPYLLYAKSLIALALDENKVIDVPDEEADDDDDDDEDYDDNNDDDDDDVGDENQVVEKPTNDSDNNKETVETSVKDTKNNNDETKIVSNGGGGGSKLLAAINESTEPETVIDSTDDIEKKKKNVQNEKSSVEKSKTTEEESQVSSTDDASTENRKEVTSGDEVVKKNGILESSSTKSINNDGEKPSTSNGEKAIENGEDIEDDDAASNLQLAWEILELAAKIFQRQGECGLPNLAEVQTELANIEFENNILEAAREDYHKALSIYNQLPSNYRRAMAEIHYKIGLSYLMQQLNKEGSDALRDACKLIEGEIAEIKAKTEISDKDKNNIEDMEETKQEIWAKIAEIEEAQAQNIAEVRAALDSYIKPLNSVDTDAAAAAAAAGTSKTSSADAATLPAPSSSTTSSSMAISSSVKPKDISHLIKRKRPEEPTSEAEAASPAKRSAAM